jgi:hypothetical protein
MAAVSPGGRQALLLVGGKVVVGGGMRAGQQVSGTFVPVVMP